MIMLVHKGQGLRARFLALKTFLETTYVKRTAARSVVSGVTKRSKSSYIHHVGSEPLQHCSVGQVLERAANTWPERPAVVACGETKTLLYSELLTQADRLAASFLEMGLVAGDRLGIWCPNTTQWVITMMAAARSGLVSVAINPSYEKREIDYCLKKVGVKALVVPEMLRQRDNYKLLAELLPGLTRSRPGQLCEADFPDLKSIVVITDKNDLPGVYTFERLLESADALAAGAVGRRQHLINPDSGCNIQFTSGTTGQPKAPLLSHDNIVNNGYYTGIRNELNFGHNKICVQVPLFHVFGLVIAIAGGLQHGATLVLPASTYSTSANLRALITEKCSTIFGTPTMYVDLVSAMAKSAGAAGRSVARVASTGGSLVSPQLVRDMARVLNVDIVKSIYGMTETAAVSFQSLPGETADRPTLSVGHVHDHLQVKVVDPNGNMVEFGEPGELYVRGYSTMLGYWGDEKKTQEIVGEDRWVRTGDQVILQEDGYCNVVGRLKDIIIRGGENIAPREIEDVISAHPDVLECHVFGVSDARLGEDVCAAVRMREGAAFDAQALTRHCVASGQLAKYKLPRYIKNVDSFPKTTSGKVQKYRLREMAEKGEI